MSTETSNLKQNTIECAQNADSNYLKRSKYTRARVCMWVHMCAIYVPVFSTHIHTPNTEVVWYSRAIMIIYLRRNARSLRRLPVAGTVNDYSSSQRNHGYGLAS